MKMRLTPMFRHFNLSDWYSNNKSFYKLMKIH